jgi:hypothetical protein
LRTKGDDRGQSARREKGKQYDCGESISSYFEQNGDGHDDQYDVFTQQRDEDGVQHDYFVAESVSFRRLFAESSSEYFREKTFAVPGQLAVILKPVLSELHAKAL